MNSVIEGCVRRKRLHEEPQITVAQRDFDLALLITEVHDRADPERLELASLPPRGRLRADHNGPRQRLVARRRFQTTSVPEMFRAPSSRVCSKGCGRSPYW